MGELVILSDVRGWVPKDRTELLLEWRLMGEQLALGQLAAWLGAVTPARSLRPDALVLRYPNAGGRQ